MIADYIVGISRVMPRGGYRLLLLLSRFIPGLRKYPIYLPIAPNVALHANLANNVFFPLLKHGYYTHQVAEDFIIRTILKDEDIVIDVGANIGYVSLLCAQCIGNGAVHSFEPSAISFKYVEQLASQVKQIKPWHFAVSNTSGTVCFVDETMLDRSHISDNQDRRGYLVECCTIDDWADKNHIERIDFIKVDAEGHDRQVMEGARAVIKLHQPIIEFEADNREDVSSINDILQSLNSAGGYRIYRCCNRYPISIRGKVVELNNWFAIPDRRLFDFPVFLFRRGFLALADFGSNA